VEEVRKALRMTVEDVAKDSADLKARKASLAKATQELRTVTDMYRALSLTEWRDETLEPALAEVDREAREELAKRMEESLRRLLAEGSTTSRLSAAAFIGALGPGLRETGARTAMTRRLTGDLIKLTDDSELRVRDEAARALSNITPEPTEAAPALGKLLKAEEVSLRRTAAESLINLIREDMQLVSGKGKSTTGVQSTWSDVLRTAAAVVPEATTGFTDSDAAVRRLCTEAVQEAAFTLYDYLFEPIKTARTPAVQDPLRSSEELRKPIPGERPNAAGGELEAVQNLTKILANHTMSLVGVLGDPDARVRLASRRALENMADARRRLEGHASAPGTPIPMRERLPAPAREIKEPNKKSATGAGAEEAEAQAGEQPPVSEASQNLLRGIRGPLEKLAAGVHDPDPQVRLVTLDVLELLGDNAIPVGGALVDALRDSDKFVRWAAARTLGKITTPLLPDRAVPGLARMLEDVDLDVRLMAATTLEHYGPSAKGAIPVLARTINRGDTEIRIAALKALQGIGTDSLLVLPAITAALSQPDLRVRQAAAEVLGRFGPLAKEAMGPLQKALDDEDPDVRKAASEAILSIMSPAAEAEKSK
jgi:HEAT repeat protein